MIKICHISTVHKISDTRVFYKECVSMAKHFDLSLVITHDRKEVRDGVKIVPLPQNKNRFFRLTVKTTLALFKALATRSRVYHIHDPELIIVGFFLCLIGKKVVYDMHELVYFQITDKKWLGGIRFRKFVAGLYRFFESIAVRLFSRIVLAEKGYYPYFEHYYPKQLKKVMFIRNFPILSMIDQQETHLYEDGKITLIYAGGLTRIRGIKELCEGVRAAKSNVRLVLLGPWESKTFEQECLGGNSKVDYKGVLPLDQVFPYMKGADIGCALLHPLENHMKSSLIKTYEYMACALPMLLSDFESWREEFGPFSVFADPLSIEDIAEKIDWSVAHMAEMKDIGILGKKEVHEKYSWANEAEKLADCYRSI